jgi:phosphopantothenoylcysteine decarboxylase/phosphopantothenate--cysteine ligase
MHPSEAIRGDKSDYLSGKRIVVGITGSIAAVESVKILRELIRHGAEVFPVMSREATGIITPDAIEFASGKEPVVDLTGQVEHVQLFGPGKGRADLLLIAPASANTLTKIAGGISDTSVTTCACMALGSEIPVVVAPAMHSEMTRNPFVAAKLKVLEQAGVTVVPPLMEEGEAKLATPATVVAYAMHALSRGPLRGKQVMVIGGATAEPIDDVRTISNGGSGRMAVELSSWAFRMGAKVTLWLGESRVPAHPYVPVQRFKTLKELEQLIDKNLAQLKGTSLLLMPAALADFTVEGRKEGKIESEASPTLTVKLVRAKKLLPELRTRLPPSVRIIGFKLASTRTTDELVGTGQKLLKEAKLDGVVANNPVTMGAEEATVYLILKSGKSLKLSGDKSRVSQKLLEALGETGK